MKTLLTIVIASGLAAGSAFAQNGNPCPGEKEYQLNIIGVAKGKTPEMTGNNGHRIFVNLTGKSVINMTGDTDSVTAGLQCGDNFLVTDANATGTSNPATLLVPCTNVNATSTDPGVCFDVYATALGTAGNVNVDVVCTFDGTVAGTDIDAGTCETGNIDFSLSKNGKPVQVPITDYMRASGCFDANSNLTCDAGEKTFNNIWIFNLEALVSYYWDYDNAGQRVSQIRFCASTNCGEFGVVPGA
ncbi:MAG: hypothetical protein JJE04_09375 [Acidobacteriia bacterium]|nr:hypothetical protein [Terriglobia bacterium]